MGFTYPPIIGDSTLYNPRFYPSIGADGVLTYDFAQTLYLSKNDYRLSYLSGVIPGSATSGSALVLDETLSLSGLGSVSCSALTVGGVAVGTLPTFLNGITPGTAANSKALVLGASGEIGTISSLTATQITGTLQTAAQGNITSVGTLSSLTVSGSITGTLATAAQTNITSIGTLSSLTVSGSITGTLATAAQTNITSIGTLSSLTVSETATVSTLSASNGININGSLFVNSAREVYASNLSGTIQTAAQPNITSIGVLSTPTDGEYLLVGTSMDKYNIILGNESNAAAAAGIAFYSNTSPIFTSHSPGASIIARKVSTTIAGSGMDLIFSL